MDVCDFKVDILLWLIDGKNRSFNSCQKLEIEWSIENFFCFPHSEKIISLKWHSLFHPTLMIAFKYFSNSWVQKFRFLSYKMKCLLFFSEKKNRTSWFLNFLWNLFKAIFPRLPQYMHPGDFEYFRSAANLWPDFRTASPKLNLNESHKGSKHLRDEICQKIHDIFDLSTSIFQFCSQK